MKFIDNYLHTLKDYIWGIPLLVLLIGTGIYLTFLLKGVQFRYLGYAMKQVFAKQRENSEGDINHFEALMTSLAGAIGTGTIVGVATSIAIGGLGALFWMWVSALFGMATKYSESLLAVKFRVIDERGEMMGGPMQYMERGLGWKWLAVIFAIIGAVAAISTGNLVQVNAITETMGTLTQIEPIWVGVFLAFMTGLVIIGGVKTIGHVAGVLVPVMALFYISAGLFILVVHYDKIPEAFSVIISSAFNGQAAFGGFAGSTIMMAVQWGVARSIFSNEAGLGISTISAAAAKTDSPGRQAMITMTGALISTVVVCSITGLVLAVTQSLGKVDESGQMLTGATVAILAFDSTIIGGSYIVSIGLILFAFSTIIAWAYYGEKCFEYIFGSRFVLIYRILFALIIIPGSILKMETAWHVADITNGLMVVPNLVAVLALSSVVVAETKVFLSSVDSEIEREKAQR